MKTIYLAILILLTLTTNLWAQVPAYVPTSGLVGWWPFSGNANDLSGNGYHGSINGATLTSDRFGNTNQAYNFDGNDDIVFQNTNNISFTNGITLSAWINASAIKMASIVDKVPLCSSNSNGIRINVRDNGEVHSGIGCYGVGVGSIAPNAYSINSWKHVLGTWSPDGTMKIYINGVLIQTIQSNYFSIGNTEPIEVGKAEYSPFSALYERFEGKIDDIGVWNRALTQAEITSLYNANSGVISSLNCNSFTQSGNLYSGQVATNVSIGISYAGGNAGTYSAQTYNSSGVTGLVATLVSGNFANGSGTLNFNISGQPSSTGNAIFNISIGGQTCSLIVPITSLSAQYPANSLFCTNGPTAIVDVTNPTTGRTWMDRNLGASQAATSSTDQNAFGDLYQWGRRSDGHQCRTSAATTTLSNVDQPTNGNFIIAPNAPTDWRSPQNNNLWQGTTGTNNPCPFGYRIPTEQEFIAEQNSWTNQNASGAFNSVLKIPLAGDRYNTDALIYGGNQYASIWTSTTSGTFSKDFAITTSGTYFNINDRADGRCIRCIKEIAASLGAINCNGVTTSTSIFANQAITGATTSIPYTGGNGGLYAAQILNSTGVTGLTATLNAGLLSNGAGSLTLTLSGTPSAVGFASFTIEIGGQNCTFNVQVNSQGTVSASSSTICAGQSTTLTASSTNTGTPCAGNGLPSSLTTGLVGYWPFCGNANDASGNGNNGTPMNGVALTTDRFGNANSAYNFDGVDDFIETQNINFGGQSNYSISAWFKLNVSYSAGFPQHYLLWNGSTSSPVYINVDNDQLQIPCTQLLSSTSINNWHNIAIIKTNSTVNLYLDGIYLTSSICSSVFSNNYPLRFGATALNTEYTNGTIDDIGIWNRALTASEIQQLYTQGQTTYSWSPGGATTPSITVSPTTTSTYTCTVTNSGATSTLTQTVTVNPIPTVNAGADQTVFAGSPVTLAGSGATSYTWNNGVTNNTPFTANATTTYTVTGTSNGCTATDQVLVTVLPAPTVSASSSTICAGQSTTLTAASASIGTPCASTGLPSSLTTGLVGYWPFCGNANDASGNGNNGTPMNGVALTTDRFGNANSAYSFDGVDDRIDIADNTNQLIFGSQAAVTLSIWVQKLSTNISGDPISKGWHSGTFSLGNKYLAFGYESTSNSYNFSLYNATTLNSIQSSVNATVNQWDHLVIVRSSTMKFYINGVEVGINALNAGWNVDYNSFITNSPLTFGARNNLSAPSTPFWSNFWDGKLDDIGIWNRTLTASEIQQLYNQGQATYSWSPGGANTPSITVSPTTTTTYTCTITNGGATSTLTQTVTVNPIPTVNAGADQTVFAGSSVTLAGSGATTYTWSNGITNNTPFTANATNTYTVTGTSNGCTATDQVLVTVLPAPTVSAISSTICAGQSTTLTASSTNTGTPCAGNGLPNSLTTGLVGYWPFCGNANDASGNGNNGTPINGAALTTDRFGNSNSAYSFDGVNDYIEVPHSNSISITGDITMSAWVRTNGSNGQNYQTIISKRETYWTWEYNMILSYHNNIVHNTKLIGSRAIGAGQQEQVWSNTPYSQNQWEHWVVNISGGQLKIYKNGILDISQSFSMVPFSQICPLLFGRNSLADISEQFFGSLDDIGIWNRALTASEIQQLYTQGQATYSWSPGGANTPSITVSPTTTTTYTCTITNGGATSTLTQTVTVNPIPTVNAGVDQTVFAGSSVTLVGSGATSYSWNNGVTNNTPFTANATTTYTVTGTSNGCTATDQVLVTVLPAPTVSASSSTICAGQSSTLTAASASSGTPCATTGLPSSLTTGLVGYWPFCGNANDASGNGYNGTVNGASLTTDRFGSANSAYVGTSTFQNIVTSFPGILGTNNRSVSIWFNQNSPNNSSDQWTLFNYSGNGFGEGFGAFIFPGNNLGIDIGNSYVSYNPVITLNVWHQLTVVYSSSFGNTVSAVMLYLDGVLLTSYANQYNPSTTINTGNSYSNLTFGGNPSFGPQQFLGKLDDIGIWNRVLTASEIQQLYTQGQATYSWSPGGATTPSISVSPTTTTTYTCTITNGGATSTLTQTVTVNPLPTVNAGTDQTVFAGSSVTLAGSGATSYSWNNGVTNNTPFTASATTTYTVTGTSNGCTATDQVLVTVLPAPTLSASSSAICAGQSTTLTAASASTGTPCASTGLPSSLTTGLVGYWPFCGNANDASGNGYNGTVNGATLTTDRFGSTNSAYNFTSNFIEITGLSQQLNSDYSISFWIQPFQNVDGYTTAFQLNQGTSCNLSPITGFWSNNLIYSTCSNINGNVQLGTFSSLQNLWSHYVVTLNAGVTRVYKNGVLLTSGNISWPTTIANKLTIGNNGNDASGPGTIHNSPFKGNLDDFGMWNRSLTASEIQQLYTQGQTTYSWSPGGATTPSITVSPTTTTTYTCTITNGGATSTLTQTVTVNPIPTVNAGSDQTVFAGNSVILAGSGATTYSWNNGVTNNTPFTANATTTYTVTGTSNGCTATDQVLVTVLPAPTVTASSSTICAGQSTTLTAASASTGTPCASTGLPSSLTTGLVGYWPFCGNANDASGNGSNGTVNGATLTTDRFGSANSAYSFDGNDSISVFSNANLQLTQSSPKSIQLWFNSTSGNTGALITKYQNGNPNNSSIFIGVISQNLLQIGGNGTATFPTVPYTPNQWNNLTLVYNPTSSNTCNIYLNGTFINTVSFPNNTTTNPTKLKFGSSDCPPNDPNCNFFNGKLDDIGIWNRALTATEIQQLYNQGQATYSWSPGGATTPSITVSPTTTTTYTCTVTNGGATTTVSQTVVVNAVPTVNAGIDQTVFAGNLVTLSGSGAASYSWDNGVTNNVPFAASTTTNYTVTGTTNGCSSTDQVLVTVLPNATISATNTTLCAGQSTTITANVSALSAPCSSSGLAGTLSNGLVGYWPFCGNANDASGNGNNGTNLGGTFSQDRFGNNSSCLDLNGTSRVDVGNLNLGDPNTSYTYSNWFKTSATGNPHRTMIADYNSSSNDDNVFACWNFLENNNQVVAATRVYPNSYTASSNASLNDNQWHHLTSVINRSTNRLLIYIDGVLNSSVVIPANINFNENGFLRFGIHKWNNTFQSGLFWLGQLDDIGIWNRALTAAEIQQLYTQGQATYAWSPGGANTPSITVSPTATTTYTCTVTVNGVSTNVSQTITVNPAPAPTIIASGPLTFCQGGSVTLTSTAAQSYLWNNSATSQAINVTASGSYTVTVVNDKGCTGTSAPVLVTVISNPPANVNVIGGTSICAGQSTTLSAPAGYSYIWNTGAQTQFLTVTQSGNYTVQVTNANGCSSVSASILINVNALPNATISASGPTNFCQGQSVMLTAPAASSYLWSNGAQTQSIIVSTAGTYSVTVTGQGGCTATSTPVTVNVYALPSPTIFASGTTTFCQGGSVILSAPSGYTYLWTTGSQLQNLIVTNSGTYQVLISNAFGCQIMSNPATVVVNPLPNVNAGMDQTVCAGTPVTLLGSGATSFSWNNGVSNGVPFVPTSTQTYTVTGTNSFGCTAQDQVLVTVNALPTVSAGPNQNICAGQSAVLVGTGAQYYLWSGGVINGNPFTPLATQTYTVTGYNAAGCSNTASTTITVNPLPTAVPGANATITCSNSASGVQIGSAPVAGLQYSWSPTTGLSSPFVANPFANPTTTTIYSLVVTNASGCSNIGQVTVNVNTTPPLALTGPNVEILCSNPNGVSIGAAPVAGLTYSWSPSTGLSASNIANPIANPSTTTIYMLTVTNPATGCSANASVTVFVNNTSPTVNAGPDLQVCQGQAVTLNGSGLNANTFTWNNNVLNGVPFVPTSTGTYTLTGTNSANGCTATDQVVITVNPLPTVSAGNNLQICAGTAVTLNGSGASAYTWNNGVTNGVAFTPTATQTYTVTGTNSNGCSNTASVTVTILPGIVVSAGPDQTVCAGTAVTLNGFGANSYSWNNNVSNGVSFIPTTTQTYTVTGTNGNGCAGTDDVTITVVPAPLALITPAGPLTLCPGGSIILSTGIASTYQWRLNGSNILNATQQSYTATAAGSYTVKVTNANGCSVISAAVQVNLGTAPTASITANGPTAICAGSSVVLTSNAAASYQWLNNGAPIVNQTNQSFTVSAPGNYSVTITNAAGCTATSNIIQVSTAPNPVPVISANGPTAICAGSTLQLSTTATGTLQWYLNGLPIAGATSNSYGATLAGNYSLMVNYASGCQGTSAALTVTLGPPPVPTITPTGPLSLCSGGSVTMTVSAAASYQWKLNGTAIGGALSQSYTATAPGSYTVTVVYPNGCTATSAATFVSGSSIITPIIVANGSTTICAGASIELIASGTGSFAWNLNGNPILPAVNSPNLIATAAGDYTVTVSNAAGCSATSNPTTITVVSLAAPTITASGSSTICAGANLTLSTTASGPYQWKLNGAPISGGNSSSITVNASGVYSLTVNNASGCSANSNNLTVTVVPLPTVSISANGSTVICQGSSVQLGAIASPGCTYQWKRNGIPQSNGQAATFMANNTGSYTVTVTNATGCQTTSNVLVISQLQATLTALGSTTICQGSSVTLQATTGTGYAYQWIKNGQYALNSTANASLTVTTSGTYKVEITTASGCVLMTNTIQVTVIQNPTATITATGSTTICSGSSMTLLVNNGGPNVTYQWKKNGVNIQNANGTSLTVTEAGIYTVAVANIACPTSSQVISNAITITVNPTPTPNINTTATTIPLGSSVTLFTTNVAGITYQWQKLNGNVWQNINGATNTSYSANTAGAYRVKATNSFGCSGYSSVVNLIMFQMPQIDDVVKSLPELNIALYPNPTNEVIYLDVPDTLIGQTYTILDINGRILFKETILEKTSTISVLNLARGTYWIQMENTQPLQFVKN